MDRTLTSEQFHEFNNALAILQLSVAQLARNASDPAQVQLNLGKIERAVKRIEKIAKEIKSTSS